MISLKSTAIPLSWMYFAIMFLIFGNNSLALSIEQSSSARVM